MRDPLDSIPMLMVRLDRDGRVAEVNRRFEELTQWPRGEARGRDWFDTFVPERERERGRQMFRRAPPGITTSGKIDLLLARDGRVRSIEWHCSAPTDAAGAVCAGVDVTERVRAEDARAQRQWNLARIIENAPFCIHEIDLSGNLLSMNGAGLRMLGLKSEGEIRGRPYVDYVEEKDRARVLAIILGVMQGEPAEIEFETENGNFYLTSVVPLFDSAGRIERIMGITVEITERRGMERRLERAEQSMRLALDASGQATWELDPAAKVARYSPQYARMLGYAPEEHAGQDEAAFAASVHPSDVERVFAAMNDHFEGKTEKYVAEFRLRTKNDAWKWILANGKIVERDANGRPSRLIGTHTDIDDRKAAELQIAASLREKELLLREIHHRVKNNLQMVSSLMHFHAKKLRPPEASAAFADIRQRLSAMTLVHERLYQSHDVARVELSDYLRALIADLRRSFERRDGVRIDIEADDVRLPLEHALPTGMIVCELVTNVLKYAFPGARAGTALVSVRASEGRIVLGVDDDGVGFPAGFDPRGGDSFGWELVRTLVLQLDGAVEAFTGRGAHVRVSFPTPAAPRGGA